MTAALRWLARRLPGRHRTPRVRVPDRVDRMADPRPQPHEFDGVRARVTR